MHGAAAPIAPAARPEAEQRSSLAPVLPPYLPNHKPTPVEKLWRQRGELSRCDPLVQSSGAEVGLELTRFRGHGTTGNVSLEV